MKPSDVLSFWFEEVTSKQHFSKDEKFDALITERFGELHTDIANGKYKELEESSEGSLALIIILDQFSRNMFRDTAQAFTYDAEALRIARRATERGFDKDLTQEKRHFLYMPFMHSENKEDHKVAVDLFSSLENKETLKYELDHKRIIDRFGRYPHRNKILGRETTPEEKEFLESD